MPQIKIRNSSRTSSSIRSAATRSPVSPEARSPSTRDPPAAFVAAHQQVRAYERLQVAVQHSINIADFCLGAMVLYKAIRRQHIGADLRAEIDVELGVLDFLRGLAFLLQLVFIQLRAQDAHGALAVLVLRTLVLATDHDAGRQVGDAYRRIGRIH